MVGCHRCGLLHRLEEYLRGENQRLQADLTVAKMTKVALERDGLNSLLLRVAGDKVRCASLLTLIALLFFST